MSIMNEVELKQFIHDCQINGSHKLANTLFELLAYREAQGKAVAYYYPGSDTETEQLGFPHQLDEEQKRNCLPLFTAPQLPAAPDVWITYYPDTEDEAFIAHSESGSESCARRIAKEIGGYVVPVYHGDPSYE